jgi:hypothetical protein
MVGEYLASTIERFTARDRTRLEHLEKDRVSTIPLVSAAYALHERLHKILYEGFAAKQVNLGAPSALASAHPHGG